MAGGGASEVFLADRANRVVRTFDVRSGQLAARDVFRWSNRREFCFECGVQRARAHRHAVPFYTASNGMHTVRSLARDPDCEFAWRECHSIEVQIEGMLQCAHWATADFWS